MKDCSVESATEKFTSVVKCALELFIPKSSGRSRRYPEWFSNDLIHYLHQKKHFHKMYKKTRKQVWYEKYDICRRLVKGLYGIDMRAYYRAIEQSLFHKPQQFWKYVNRHTRDNNDSICLIEGSVRYSDPHEVANKFASHFSTCFTAPTKRADPGEFNPGVLETFFFDRVETDDIVQALRKLKPKRSFGADGIPAFVVKGCSDLFVPILHHLFNLSLRTGVFPTIWKEAIVVPVHKSGSVTTAGNYRPVSMLCSFSKVFEIVIHSRLFAYVRNKLCSAQHGFITGKSVETNLVEYLTQCVPYVMERGQVDTVYFDLTKAFDRVSHRLLLHKLGMYGICGKMKSWFQSYLTGRWNTVSVLNSNSTSYTSLSGVPQGSNLGPLLFLLFVNDIANNVVSTNILMYADDIKLFVRIRDISDCYLLQRDIISICRWCQENDLLINPVKTKVLTLSRKKDPVIFDYAIGNSRIARVTSIRDLGVYVDSTLSFTEHAVNLVSTTTRLLGILCRITKHFTSYHCLLRLYLSIIRPRLEFASVVWNCLPELYCMKLENVQRRLVRVIYDRYIGRRQYYEYSAILSELKIDTLYSRRCVRDVMFLFKVVNGMITCDQFLPTLCFNVPSRRCRKVLYFYPVGQCKSSPSSRLQIAFNKLSSDVDLFTNFVTFKRFVVAHYVLRFN